MACGFIYSRIQKEPRASRYRNRILQRWSMLNHILCTEYNEVAGFQVGRVYSVPELGLNINEKSKQERFAVDRTVIGGSFG
mgnify:CR=1 FL=1